MRAVVKLNRHIIVVTYAFHFLYVITKLASATVTFKPYSFPDLPAKFALGINETGICGALHVADPLDACSPLRNGSGSTGGGGVGIALAVRGECSFDEKIRNAQSSGFQAVIVYDDKETGNLVYMMLDPKGIKVHAVFVSNEAGKTLKELAREEEGECCIFQASGDNAWAALAFFFITTFVILAFIILAVITHREWLYWQRLNFPSRNVVDAKMVEALPRSTFKLASSFPSHLRETCAICLEDYQDGEDLKVLPCQHEFHSTCVDSWLTKWGTCCPVCKMEVKIKFSFHDVVKRRIWFQNR